MLPLGRTASATKPEVSRRHVAAPALVVPFCATSSIRGREPSAALIPASDIATAVAGASTGGATAGVQSDNRRTYRSNHRSDQNRDGNDAYVASEACGQTKATELGMNISRQG